MSVRGTLQLSKMSIFYCPRTGTSRGVLQFLDGLLGKQPKDENANASDVVKRVLSLHQTRGRDPHLKCVYLSGREKTIGLKNKSEEEIARLVERCASEKGYDGKKMKGGRVHRTRRESVQGAWTSGGAS